MASVTVAKKQPALLPGKASERLNLIRDIQELQRKSPQATITRNFYRAHGHHSEARWQKFFSKFSDFLKAAGLGVPDTPATQPRQSNPTPKLTETSEIVDDTWHIKMPSTRIHTLDQLLEHFQIDLLVWEVKGFVVNKWEVGTFVDSAAGVAAQVEPMFQLKATLKRRAEMSAVLAEVSDLKDEAKREARVPRFEIGCVTLKDSGNMLEINIPDPHFGKLAWGDETGHEHYDTAIAQETYLRALRTLVDRAENTGIEFEQILYVVGNDLLNSDDNEGRTTKGTYVSTDGRYEKTFGIVRRTVTDAIELLRQLAPVKVVMVRGNHDNLSIWHLGDSLECTFAKYTDVEIDNTPPHRKYHRFGDVLLMFCHGDKGKRADYPLLMAREQSELFGQTRFHEVHTGHTHQTKTEEFHGVRVRVLPALCPPDAWHAENGFVGNQRSAEAYIWNANEGLIAQVFYNDVNLPEAA